MQNVCECECELRIFVTNTNIFVIRADPYFRELPRLEREKSVLVNEEYHSQVYGVLEINEQDWFGEKWLHGVTFPSTWPGKISELGPALKEPFVNIHFAGTETASVFRGYMEGAVEAGERAAAEVVQEFKRPGFQRVYTDMPHL